VFLVLLTTKAEVGTLGDRLPLPGDTGFLPTQVRAGAGRIHLSQVNHDSVHLYQDLVAWGPCINLVQSKVDGHPVRLHRLWASTPRDAN